MEEDEGSVMLDGHAQVGNRQSIPRGHGFGEDFEDQSAGAWPHRRIPPGKRLPECGWRTPRGRMVAFPFTEVELSAACQRSDGKDGEAARPWEEFSDGSLPEKGNRHEW